MVTWAEDGRRVTLTPRHRKTKFARSKAKKEGNFADVSQGSAMKEDGRKITLRLSESAKNKVGNIWSIFIGYSFSIL